MKIQKIAGLTIAALTMVLTGGTVFAADKAPVNRKDKPAVERVDKETAAMKAERAKAYQARVESINLAVKEGKMEKPRADFHLKWLANDKAFKDANPEWTKYLFRGGMPGVKPDGKKEGPRAVQPGTPTHYPMPVKPEVTQAEWTKNYQARVDNINLAVKEGRMEKAQGDFLLKWMANDKAFKDANPDWVKYGVIGPGFHGKKGESSAAPDPDKKGAEPTTRKR